MHTRLHENQCRIERQGKRVKIGVSNLYRMEYIMFPLEKVLDLILRVKNYGVCVCV
jgi:hypothetical protein